MNLGTARPVVSLNIFTAQDMRGVDRLELTKIMDELVREYQESGRNITYDYSVDGCQVTLCNTKQMLSSCSIEYSMRRFNRCQPLNATLSVYD
jgi:hypothetical protein